MFINATQGEVADLGIAAMRLLVGAESTGGALGMAEFNGRAGAWTIPHVHHGLEEYFYVLGGTFTFQCGEETLLAERGAFLMVPRGTRHVLEATSEAASLLCLWTPGGLEQMFLELARLDPQSLTDPAVRAEVSKRHDSVPG